MSAPPVATEHAEQVALVRWFSVKYRHQYPADCLVALPNAGKRSFVVGKRMRSEGLRKGALDLFLRIPSGGAHGLWIEMKREGATKSSVDDDQFADIGLCLRMGYAATWCAGCTEAMAVIDAYLERAGG
jgi:hypothetical protein